MKNPDFYGLFKDSLNGFKELSNGQFIAICPFHTDSKPSFSGNHNSGLWNCKACDKKGNAYYYAKDMNVPNPHQYILDDSNGYKEQYQQNVDLRVNSTESTENLIQMMNEFKSNLKKNMDIFPQKLWDKSLIDKYGIGIDKNDVWAYAYYDSKKILQGIKIHKSRTIGDGKCKWYIADNIATFDRNKPLYICEGEKDVLALLSHNYQAITQTAGATSIPKDKDGNYDLDWFYDFLDIYICYDYDKAGIEGAKKLADALIKRHPHLVVKIIQWDSSLKKGFDVYDALQDNDWKWFFDGLANAKEIKRSNKIGGLELITGIEALSTNVLPTRQIIDNIMPEKSQIILGGTTGANKSYLAMQMGMAIANNEKEFLGFKINVNDLKVLYCDTECGKNTLLKRFQTLQNHFKKWEGNNRFSLVPRVSTTTSIYDDLESAIKIVKPDLVIIDCLYNTTDGADISKNHHISPILNRISDIKMKYDCTIFAVHHCNKGGHQEGLLIDRISGGSAVQNWTEHCIMITRTNESHIRLLSIVKSRHIDYPDCYYELEWDAELQKLSNLGISKDWKKLMLTSDKKYNWENVLRDLADEFTKLDFRNMVENVMKLSERTATNWLQDMIRCGVIERTKHGCYKKKLKLRGEE